ncbi:hypothetical protein [Promicromonospora sp. NPDC023987]|uniref:hypothetical protein n=1 Tax=Promicromonospora sp. NPDC023987 TaxID=3155360 RepID=UPI0033D3CC84
MFEQKRRLIGAKSTGVVLTLGLTGLIGALGATPAIAADTEGPAQTAEAPAPEATPEATPEAPAPEAPAPDATPESAPEATPEPSATDDTLIEVVPEIPAITWPRCEGDKYIPPRLSAPKDSDGIAYDFQGYWYTNPFLVPIDLEVWATLKEGYTWAAEVPEGWTVSADGGTYEVKFEDVPCAPHNDPVVPELPVVTQAECVDGELTEPTVTLPENGEGITYELADRASDPESTLDVSAKLSWSYFWAKEEKFPKGWTWSDVDVAWYDVKFDEVSCEPGAEQPAQPGADQPEQLAATGPRDVAVLGGAALLIVAAGVSLIIARRRATGR